MRLTYIFLFGFKCNNYIFSREDFLSNKKMTHWDKDEEDDQQGAPGTDADSDSN